MFSSLSLHSCLIYPAHPLYLTFCYVFPHRPNLGFLLLLYFCYSDIFLSGPPFFLFYSARSPSATSCNNASLPFLLFKSTDPFASRSPRSIFDCRYSRQKNSFPFPTRAPLLGMQTFQVTRGPCSSPHAPLPSLYAMSLRVVSPVITSGVMIYLFIKNSVLFTYTDFVPLARFSPDLLLAVPCPRRTGLLPQLYMH